MKYININYFDMRAQEFLIEFALAKKYLLQESIGWKQGLQERYSVDDITLLQEYKITYENGAIEIAFLGDPSDISYFKDWLFSLLEEKGRLLFTGFLAKKVKELKHVIKITPYEPIEFKSQLKEILKAQKIVLKQLKDIENKRYLKLLVSQSNVDIAYRRWVFRFLKLKIAYSQNIISEKELEKYQLFLMQTGQVNANLTSDEIDYLDYQKSPFAMMHEHHYLRLTNYWATEILSFLYQKDPINQEFVSVWFDSIFFLKEIERYYGHFIIVKDYKIMDVLREVLLKFLREDKLEFISWFCIEKPADKDLYEHKSSVRKEIISTLKEDIFRVIAEHKEMPLNILNFFHAIQSGKSLDEFRDNNYLMLSLRQKFPQVIEELKRGHQRSLGNFNERLNKFKEKSKTAKNNVLPVAFFCFKEEFSIIENIHTLAELNERVKSNNDLKILISSIKNKLEENEKKKEDIDRIEDYVDEVKEWCQVNLNDTYERFNREIIFCFQDRYLNVDILSIFNCSDSLGFVDSTLDDLGYRIDPVKALRLLARQFPSLFINSDQTKEFLIEFYKTSMIQALEQTEQNKIYDLFRFIEGIDISYNFPIELEEKFKFEENFSKLSSFCEYREDNFTLYFDFIKIYLKFYKKNNSDNLGFRYVVEEEIDFILKKLIAAFRQEKISEIVERAQSVSEIMILDFENRKFQSSIFQIIQKKYLFRFMVQDVILTPYAMRAFVRVFQSLESRYRKSTIFVTNQGYFELLQNIENIKHQGRKVFMAQSLSDVDESADIIFTELHPNNVLASKQFRHNIENLIGDMKKWPFKQRTLVVDVTLNVLSDEEIQNFLLLSSQLVSQGHLNIILIQSLTKFAQIGLDKRSAGMLVVINNPEYWKLDDALKLIKKSETIDFSTERYFNFFLFSPGLLSEYISLIKKACGFAYQKTLEKLNKLPIIRKERCQIVISSDAGSCYLGLSVKGLFLEADTDLMFSSRDMECFLNKLLENMFIPLCHFMNLPITQRLSIGFPMSSINVVSDVLRLTIGFEPLEQLESYSEIIMYIFVILSCQPNLKLFLGNDNISKFLDEKTRQFTAMHTKTAKYDWISPYGFEFYITDKIKVCLSSNRISVREDSTYKNFSLFLEEKGVTIPFEKINDFEKKLYLISGLSAFTEYRYISFKLRNKSVILLSSFPSAEKKFSLYGPYLILTAGTAAGAFFALGENEEVRPFYFFPPMDKPRWLNPLEFSAFFITQTAFVKKGSIYINIIDIPYEELNYLMREGAYRNYERNQFSYASGKNIEVTTAYFPLPNPLGFYPMKFSYNDQLLIIENDFISHKDFGVTIYKRYLGEFSTAVEIDFWREKEPDIVRFFTLLIAIFVKEKNNIDFVVRNYCFQHFIFSIRYDDADKLFAEATQAVLDKQTKLIGIFDKERHSRNKCRGKYSFFSTEKELEWPSGNPGIRGIENKQLIDKSINILFDSAEIAAAPQSSISLGP